MDKDQVLSEEEVLDAINDSIDGYGMYPQIYEAVKALYAELESLRAMRKRVEGLAQHFDSLVESSESIKTEYPARELRAALGDSHE